MGKFYTPSLGALTAHGRRQDIKASHTMANGLMHQKKTRKTVIELDCIGIKG